MKYYLDITLLPDVEANLGFIWQKVYQQLHLALVEIKNTQGTSDIAVSFPKYGGKIFPLGDKLRLFAETQEQLQLLNIDKWLNRYNDYVHIKSVSTTPENIKQYACFLRKNIKGIHRREKDIFRKAKHQSEKFNLPYEECLNKLKSNTPKSSSKLPFISIRRSPLETLEGKNSFNVFIEQKLTNQEYKNKFSCYGLSFTDKTKIATVPWF